MSQQIRLERVDALVEALTLCADAVLRERILLEMALLCGSCQAAAVWRWLPAAAGSSERVGFRLTAQRGRLETLPAPELALAAIEGRIPMPLPGRHALLCSGNGPGNVALLLSDTDCDARSMDLLEGLFQVWSAVERTEPYAPDETTALEAPGAALPHIRSSRSSEESSGARDLLIDDVRGLLAHLSSSDPARGGPAQAWPAEERGRAERTIERGCREVGQLLLQALAARAARPDAGCSPAIALRRAAGAQEAAYLRSGLQLQLQLAPDALKLRVALDELSLMRALSHLLVDAREALESEPSTSTPRLPPRTIAACVPGHGPAGGVAVCIEDNGHGFLTANCARGELDCTSRTRHSRGRGLPWVRQIVERARGELRICNIPIGGARVELWLPCPPA